MSFLSSANCQAFFTENGFEPKSVIHIFSCISGGAYFQNFIDILTNVVIIVVTMRFEWDENKNAENMRKHGLNFADAWQVFRNPILVKADDREDYEKGSGNYPHDLQ